jgi:hypothetical protein
MVRQDRPLLQLSVSFEATRLGPQHLIAIYARLVPVIRQRSLPQSTAVPPQPTAQGLTTRRGAHD